MKSDLSRRPSLLDRVLLFIIAAAALAIDQISKILVQSNIPLGVTVPIPFAPFLAPYLTFTHVQNTGAAFSLFQNGNAFFIAVAVIVAAVIVYYTPRLPAGDRWSRIALGLQLGGAIGNLIDRLRHGYVTDFIHLQVPEIGFDWPVSNIADICIVSGVILLIAWSIRQERAHAHTETQSQPDQQTRQESTTE
ncbi:MAG: signal peptidase II [Anaerolineae bacterium]|nr:signal peptidase II [Thermoflexales bacterium]MDW8407018.1 signal peptidase II [Anaerolineae bacterium]